MLLAFEKQLKSYQLYWTGSFWINKGTQNIKSNAYHWYRSFTVVNGLIEDAFAQHFDRKNYSGNKWYSHVTVARLDIAENKTGNLVNAIPIKHPNVHPPTYYEVDNDRKPYIGGISIGKRTNGTFFRAYDKRFDLDGIESSLRRFQTVNYVRREWELKRETLRPLGISSPEDLMAICHDKEMVTELIYRIRLNRDVILETDKKLYRSIHDDIDKARINPLDGYSMTGHEFNKMLKKDYNIFLRKPNPKEIKRISFNPFKQLNGLITKKGIYLNADEIVKLIHGLIGADYLKECAEDEYQEKYEETLNLIKSDKRIKDGLKNILVKGF